MNAGIENSPVVTDVAWERLVLVRSEIRFSWGTLPGHIIHTSAANMDQ